MPSIRGAHLFLLLALVLPFRSVHLAAAAGFIEGRVTDRRGEPIAGAGVSVYLEAIGGGFEKAPGRRELLRTGPLSLCVAGLLLAGMARATEPPVPSSPPVAQPSYHPREPWKWTLEERLAVRFDPVHMRRRATENEAENDAPPYPEGTCIVEGARYPELLMPFELFSGLLRRVFSPVDEMRETYRQEILEQGRALGFDESLWPVLEDLARDEILSMKKARGSAKLYDEKGIRPPGLNTAEQKAECAKRAQARRAVRAYLGGERFDRLLYEIIAPHIAIFTADHPERKEQIRLLEKGCQ